MRIFFFLIVVHFSLEIMAQKAVLLKKANGQHQAFYGNQPFIDAYNAAAHGDSIYLPGGHFTSPAEINKRLAVYGAGHYPDSTLATGKTIVTNTFSIGPSADSLLMEGMEFATYITVNQDVNYMILKRNIFLSTVTFAYSPACSNPRFEGNVFRAAVNLANSANSLLVNNIFEGSLVGGKNGDLVRNNIFIHVLTPLQSCQYTVFENNIFKTTNDPNFLAYGENSFNTFANNVFTTSPAWGSNANINNYINADPALLFVNQTGTTFNYAHNYHLQSPGTFIGTDATQCGIYGGLFVYKEGAVPANPHIRQKVIAGVTDINGNLNVNITVAAQNN